jgi:hypothetical protein
MRLSFCGSSFSFSKTGLLFLALSCSRGEVEAQTPSGPAELTVEGPGNPGGGGWVDPTAVPIDGGAGWLLAAGAGYGIKKLRERRRKNSETETSETEDIPQPQVL